MHPSNIKVIWQLFILLAGLQPALAQVEFSSSELPIVLIDTDEQEIVDDPRIIARMNIIYKGPGQLNHRDDPPNNYSGRISIEIRGATAQMLPKKSYGLETQVLSGENLNISLVDMPAENDWVLYGPYRDKTLIRNILIYTLFREMGHYSPRTSLCELILNEEYRGVYVLTEKIKQGKNRLDIAKLRPDEITGDSLTGGYILKIDKQEGNSGPVWESQHGGIGFQYEYPGYDEIVQEQKDYILDYINSLETALTGPEFADSINGYRKYLDVNSAIDFFIVNEISKNVDAYFLSTFLYKDNVSRGGKLYMGPVWDYNLSLGNADYREGYKTSGLQLHVNNSIWWWDRLLEDPLFVRGIRDRWQELRTHTLSNQHLEEMVDSLTNMLHGAQERNFEQWDILGIYVWPNYFIGESFEDEINYLEEWLGERLSWLDIHLQDWTATEDISTSTDHWVFPNPFRAQFVYTFSTEEAAGGSPDLAKLYLTDLQGRKIRTLAANSLLMPGKQSILCDASDLEPGIYLLCLELNGRIESVEKVICH